jgi:hypothetical protein
MKVFVLFIQLKLSTIYAWKFAICLRPVCSMAVIKMAKAVRRMVVDCVSRESSSEAETSQSQRAHHAGTKLRKV